MLRIAICDDEKEYIDIEHRYVDDYLTKIGIEHEIYCFLSGISFLRSIDNDKPYDLVLLDVEMKADNGMDIAKRLSDICPNTKVAFVSAHADYATMGYRVNAVRYILKSSSLEIYISECLDHVIGSRGYDNRCVTMDFTSGTRTVNVADILYLDSSKNYVRFVLADKNDKSVYKVRGSLKDITEKMQDYGFVSVSFQRSVNLSHVISVERYEAVIDNGEKISISQLKYLDVRKAYLLCKGRKI